jgi:glycosyltransferase involved in cell wall biosynthesis
MRDHLLVTSLPLRKDGSLPIMKRNISIIVCTANRAESLEMTLRSISQTAVPHDVEVELLVIDNGSSDSTAKVTEAEWLSHLHARCVFEPKPGKGYACNRALAEAKGEVLLWTDDDVRVPHDWIEPMCRPILDGQTDAMAGGVKFPDHIQAALVSSALRSRQGWVASTFEIDPTQPARMVGANMAFHRRVLQKVPMFDVELGPGALGFKDETLFSKQLLAAGFKISGALHVNVDHHFDVGRLGDEAVLEIARKMGRSHGFVFYHWEHQTSHIALLRYWWSRTRLKWELLRRRLSASNRSPSDAEIRLTEHIAFHQEYLHQSQRPRKYPKFGSVSLESTKSDPSV